MPDTDLLAAPAALWVCHCSASGGGSRPEQSCSSSLRLMNHLLHCQQRSSQQLQWRLTGEEAPFSLTAARHGLHSDMRQ